MHRWMGGPAEVFQPDVRAITQPASTSVVWLGAVCRSLLASPVYTPSCHDREARKDRAPLDSPYLSSLVVRASICNW